jgi:1-phosphofructokinase family hexose kinase
VILCVAANPSIDRLFEVERLVPGEIHRPARFAQVPGGKGLNVARAAAALGGEVRTATLLGGHAGRWIAQELEAAELDVDVAWADVETRSSLSVAGAPEGLTEFYEHGPEVAAADWARFAALVARRAPAAGWMTISGSLPPGAPADAYARLVPLARTAFDSSAAGIDARPALVKLNAGEASAATGRPVADRPGAFAAAAALHERSGGAAIVTLGRDGAVLVTADGGRLSATSGAEGRYPVGSGDAFLAGVVVELDRGRGWEAALRLGIGAAAANAEVHGAGRLHRDRAEELAAQAVVAVSP